MTTNQAWLLSAAKRVKAVMQAQVRAEYYAPNEDIDAGRELASAILAVEAEQAHARDEFEAVASDPRRA